MSVTALSVADLFIASGLVLLLAVLSFKMELGLARQMVLSAVRMTVQLLLIGLVLQSLFANRSFLLVTLVSIIMLLAAGREVRVRLKRKIRGFFGFGVGVGTMFISSFSLLSFSRLNRLLQFQWSGFFR